jgi:uridine kinase
VYKSIVCIGIAGGSSSGKTRVVNQLINDLGHKIKCFHISMDGYYKDRISIPFEKRKQLNYDIPEAFDHLLLVKHLTRILNNEEVDIPLYDFVTHTRNGTMETAPMDVLIVEGIYALYFEELRKFYGIKIFLEVSERVRTERRLGRDTVERGREKEDVITQLKDTVWPMHNKWVEKTKEYADLIIDSEKNDIKSCSKLIFKVLNEKYPDVFSKRFSV